MKKKTLAKYNGLRSSYAERASIIKATGSTWMLQVCCPQFHFHFIHIVQNFNYNHIFQTNQLAHPSKSIVQMLQWGIRWLRMVFSSLVRLSLPPVSRQHNVCNARSLTTDTAPHVSQPGTRVAHVVQPSKFEEWFDDVRIRRETRTMFSQCAYATHATAIKYRPEQAYERMTMPNKKLSYRRETARRFVSLNVLLSHSRIFEMTQLSRACVSPY